jgi:hypothetical protein
VRTLVFIKAIAMRGHLDKIFELIKLCPFLSIARKQKGA